MTRSNLIERVSGRFRIPRARAEQIVTLIFDSIEQALKLDERIEIRGFGSFEVRHYDGYVGRNPRTGETTPVKPKRLPFFKVGRELRDRVNLGAQAQRRQADQPAPSTSPPALVSDTATHHTPVPVIQPRPSLGAG
jgi:integration host factor subunit beta